MSQYESEPSELTDFIIKIENCLLKALKSTENLVSTEIVENIQLKIQEISNSDSAVSSVQYFIFSLINTVQDLKQQMHIDINNEDYENLQGAVQKAEAEIRKHIRLEQQLKIYMDGLEEKIEQLQKQLKIQSNKYHQLFQSMKSIDLQRRELRKKMADFESKEKLNHEKQIRLSHKASKILTEPSVYDGQVSGYGLYKMYNERHRITKSKNFMQKSSNIKHPQSINEQKYKKRLDQEIDVSLRQSPSLKKRNETEKTEKTEIKQLTRTIQLKQNYRKQSRKLLKYSSQQKSGILSHKRGDARCNSVCH